MAVIRTHSNYFIKIAGGAFLRDKDINATEALLVRRCSELARLAIGDMMFQCVCVASY